MRLVAVEDETCRAAHVDVERHDEDRIGDTMEAKEKGEKRRTDTSDGDRETAD